MIIALSICAFSLAASFSADQSASDRLVSALPSQNNIFTGNVTILPDGQISTPGSVTAPPISHSGLDYNFTGDMNGTLTIEKSGVNVNGMGHTLYNNSFTMGPLVNITGVSNILVSDLSLTSNSTGGVLVTNASHINLNMLNISGIGAGVAVINNTQYVNVSNSIISLENKTSNNVFDIGMGVSFTNFPTPAKSSSDNSIYNDTLSIYHANFASVFIQSNSTTFTDSSITEQAPGQVVIFDTANYTVLKGLNINAASDYAAYYAPFNVNSLYNNTFEDNSVNLSVEGYPFVTAAAVSFGSTGNISHNNIAVNANGFTSAGISLLGTQANVVENNISVFNGSNSARTYGVQAEGNNTVVNGNNFNESGGNTYGIFSMMGNYESFSSNSFNLSGTNVTAVQENSMGSNFTQILNNVINLNGTDTVYGISINGTGQSVEGNSMSVYSAYNFTGISGITNSSFGPQDLNVSGNTIMMKTTALADNETGIYLDSNQSFQSAVISNNHVLFNGNATNENGIYLFNANHTKFLKNSAVYPKFNATSGYSLYSVNNSTIAGNYLNGYGSFAGGIFLAGGNNITGYSNYVTGFAGSFGLFGVGNSTFYGNTFNDSLGALYFSNTHNMTFYHNDITLFGSPLSVSSSTNVRLNFSYPIGGNYWGGIKIADNYSGPNQNVPGSDGINDSAVTLAAGYVDYYPLVKPWTNPKAVFNETGLLPGDSWSVTFNGVTKTSIGTQIVFSIANATYQNYSYVVHTRAGYKGGGESGTFAYNGSNGFSLSTTYLQKHTFNISETGLPPGTTWYLELNGTLHEVNASSYSVTTTTVTTFTYAAENTTSYYTTSGTGKATVVGTNTTVNVQYLHWAYITGNFTQAGVNVTIDGKNIGSGDFSFNETAPAGTYHVIISGKGYVTKYENFTLSAGQTENISASLVPVMNPSPSSPVGAGVYAAIGAVGAIIAIAGALFVIRRRR